MALINVPNFPQLARLFAPIATQLPPESHIGAVCVMATNPVYNNAVPYAREGLILAVVDNPFYIVDDNPRLYYVLMDDGGLAYARFEDADTDHAIRRVQLGDGSYKTAQRLLNGETA